ncbi:MAG: molybdate ABC transporter substrate-binding protein [Phycisphaeraceae bacterium]|nr:molybdate ABC transporter substrate-binding protein [Phycisphaeraceae bacterium]
MFVLRAQPVPAPIPRPRPLSRLFALCLSLFASLLISCSPSPPPLHLLAAASIHDAAKELADLYTQRTGIRVVVSAAGSNTLASQVLAGAPADIFISASSQWADEIERGGLAANRIDLLTNRLVIAVPAGNRARIHTPSDLTGPQVERVALAGEGVPAARYAEQALSALHLLDPLTAAGRIVRAGDVRSVLAYIERAEVQAGIVYATDIARSTRVELACALDPATHDPIRYSAVLLTGRSAGPDPRAADLFEFLRSPDAAAIFRRHGFEPAE